MIAQPSPCRTVNDEISASCARMSCRSRCLDRRLVGSEECRPFRKQRCAPQRVVNIQHHIVVAGVHLHRAWVALCVHEDDGQPSRAAVSRLAGSWFKAETSLISVRPRIRRAPHHFAIARVDAERDADALGERGDDRQHAAAFLFHFDGLCARAASTRRRYRECRHLPPPAAARGRPQLPRRISPPSEKLSGVTLTMPTRRGRSSTVPPIGARGWRMRASTSSSWRSASAHFVSASTPSSRRRILWSRSMTSAAANKRSSRPATTNAGRESDSASGGSRPGVQMVGYTDVVSRIYRPGGRERAVIAGIMAPPCGYPPGRS